MAAQIVDKHGNAIHEGDYVFTRIRGGSHEGKVQEIVTDEQRAEETEVKHPPKVSKENRNPTRARVVDRST
ncbi:uncharacterized protein N7496_006155 [Penicillium cataractarum]|uniref:Hypervirulence associated protein TUDOR domain-containing protein n=1 Tax=Penicillium cataractarum TaxID=2100454 RepID=A0A9W9S5N8_9EURO|nr:uncharacterized protein N7496_006155 [Penicillium cataractarum]KAJ5370063.1 hypothetical protein N7496_006155 [Penicillium cataractarum]